MSEPNPGPAQPEVTPQVTAENDSRAAFGLTPKPASGNPANEAPKADASKPDGNLAKPAEKQPDSPEVAKTDEPKKFLGKYETPEAAEVAFKQTQSNFTKLQLEHEKNVKELADLKAQFAAIAKPGAPEKPSKAKATDVRNSPEWKSAIGKVEELGGKELVDALDVLLSAGQKDTVDDSRVTDLEERIAQYEASVRQKELESELTRIRPEFADPEVQKDVRALAKQLHEAADNELLFMEILLDANIGQKFPERLDKAVARKLSELTAKEKEKLLASHVVGDGTRSSGSKSKFGEKDIVSRQAFGLPV